ncbi:MAG TPA: class I SAM-dependent methyltransferase [Thermoanaerobaculia bacterium]|nr:class I SAM-dependent methyltransferase [Thermoanaerobaculia bacterium]
MAKIVMGRFYRAAEGRPERLPWHQENPPGILLHAVGALGRKGRALDLGCGAGVFSVWLAEQGFDVTGIDLFPEAVAMGEARAREHGVKVNFVQGDLFEFSSPQPFDLVFDSGCLHALMGGSVDKYKRQLLRWLAPQGEYVLGHWGKRHALDWRPVGPRRRSEETIAGIFAPELHVIETEVADFEAPRPFGPVVRGIGYRFTR